MHSDAKFAPTSWSLVRLAMDGNGAEAKRATAELCQLYWFPLYAFARQSDHSQADAEDLTQSFFATIFAKDLFRKADARRGKMRTFLLSSFRNWIADTNKINHAAKRGGGDATLSLDLLDAEEWYTDQRHPGESAEAMYDRQWALTILDAAVSRLAERWQSRKKEGEFTVLRRFLTEEADAEVYAEAATELNSTPNAVRVAVHRLRQRFSEILQDEVRQSIGDDSDADEELRYLLSALS